MHDPLQSCHDRQPSANSGVPGLLEVGDLGNTLILIGPFIVPGLLFLYHYIVTE